MTILHYQFPHNIAIMRYNERLRVAFFKFAYEYRLPMIKNIIIPVIPSGFRWFFIPKSFDFEYIKQASARGFTRMDFEHIPLSFVSTVYDLNPHPDLIPIRLTLDFDRSLAFNSEPVLGLSRLGLKSPALISDLGSSLFRFRTCSWF
ncbi:hypothetical protein EVAR_13853_1 [Eumeta japonica]|uniref:Uncharacterized protein n=1 Tax=Eumeta variegata TaxID=151549 RepID=A0A4C1U157_EUMVA|nr:hypothetical protein EVAR_13853_1 [Eumeta japonica]